MPQFILITPPVNAQNYVNDNYVCVYTTLTHMLVIYYWSVRNANRLYCISRFERASARSRANRTLDGEPKHGEAPPNNEQNMELNLTLLLLLLLFIKVCSVFMYFAGDRACLRSYCSATP